MEAGKPKLREIMSGIYVLFQYFHYFQTAQSLLHSLATTARKAAGEEEGEAAGEAMFQGLAQQLVYSACGTKPACC